jgi:hypothetical protein
MSTGESLEPIRLELTIECSPKNAFDAYTSRIGEWWDPRYTPSPETLEAVTIEPHVTGRVYSTHTGFGEFDWGLITTWEPGRLLVHSFTLAQYPNQPTEVIAMFLDDPVSVSADGVPQRCVLEFEHRGWTEANARFREKFSDWEHILNQFKVFAESLGTPR